MDTSFAIEVVAALLQRDGLFLVQQRRRGTELPLLWEFPGGKLEPGESHDEALRRECREELGVDIAVGTEAWRAQHTGAQQPVHLTFYWAELVVPRATPRAFAAIQVRWLAPQALVALPFCPADIGLVSALADGRLTASFSEKLSAQSAPALLSSL